MNDLYSVAEMEKHLQETSATNYIDSGVSDSISEIYGKEDPENDEPEELSKFLILSFVYRFPFISFSASIHPRFEIDISFGRRTIIDLLLHFLGFLNRIYMILKNIIKRYGITDDKEWVEAVIDIAMRSGNIIGDRKCVVMEHSLE